MEYNYPTCETEYSGFFHYLLSWFRYQFRVIGFYGRATIEKLKGSEGDTYFIHHQTYHSEEYGTIGDEYCLYDIPNKRNLVYIQGKLDIKQDWCAWVRNPLYMNTNTQHLFRIHDLSDNSIEEVKDPQLSEGWEDTDDYCFWNQLLHLSILTNNTERLSNTEELQNWYQKNDYIYGEGKW